MQHGLGRLAALAAMVGILASAAVGAPASAADGTSWVRAEAPQLEEKSGYDSSYLFAMTKAVANSTMVTAIKPPLMLVTVPLDIILLPVSLIAGFF